MLGTTQRPSNGSQYRLILLTNELVTTVICVFVCFFLEDPVDAI